MVGSNYFIRIDMVVGFIAGVVIVVAMILIINYMD
jgi:hypothetical protein